MSKPKYFPILGLFAFLGLTAVVFGQEPATYKQLVVTITSRALDKAHPEILSDTSYSVREQVFGSDAPDGCGYEDKSLGRRQGKASPVARESFVYCRPNRVTAHVAVVSGVVTEAGVKRTAYGVGVGDSSADAEGKAVVHLRSRLPGWAAVGDPHAIEHRAEFPPRSAPLPVEQKIKRKALIYIAWNYVPEVGPSAQTDIGYAVTYNEDILAAGAMPDAGWNVYPEVDDDELRQRNRNVLDKLGAYKDVRTVSAEMSIRTGMAVVVVSSRVPTSKGPVLQIYGAGIGKDYIEARGKALKNLAGHSWSWSEAEHGYKEEYRREIAPAEAGSTGILRFKRPKLGSAGVRG